MSKLDNYAKAKRTLAAVRCAMQWHCRFSGASPTGLRVYFYNDNMHSGNSLNMGTDPFRLFLKALENRMPQAIRQEAIRLAEAEMEDARAAAEQEAREVLEQVERNE